MMLSTLLPFSLSFIPLLGLLVWIPLPFLLGFCLYLLPKALPEKWISPQSHWTLNWTQALLKRGDRLLALCAMSLGLVFGLIQLLNPETIELQLIDSFGVQLLVDSLSGYFIVTNALVAAAVILYCWPKAKSAFFYAQATILYGSVNAVFICADFISLYVALEVISVAAFLLITYPRTNRSIWVGLRYLLISNTAMLFYLVGVVLVYHHNQSFGFEGLAQAPTEAIALIVLALLTKGGIFVSGLWLPLTHAESDTPVSALLSGVVVTTGVFPLIRCAEWVQDVAPIIALFSVGTAILGVLYAILAQDTKRMLAASTISQLGFVLAAPQVAGLYALTHGLAKAALFLVAGNLPSRKFAELRQQTVPLNIWLVVAIASLSISGFPLLAGFEAKALTLKDLSGWQSVVMNIVSVGTAIAFAKFLFLPFSGFRLGRRSSNQSDQMGGKISGWNTGKASGVMPPPSANPGFWGAIFVLLGSLLAIGAFRHSAYDFDNVAKALLTIGVGWILYSGLNRLFSQSLLQRQDRAIPRWIPRQGESVEHLIGGMSLVLTLLFWMVQV